MKPHWRPQKPKKSGWQFSPGMYEGKTAEDVAQEVGKAIPRRAEYRSGNSIGLTMLMPPKGGWGGGGMK